MNANVIARSPKLQGVGLWGWLKWFSLQFHFIHRVGYDEEAWIQQGISWERNVEDGMRCDGLSHEEIGQVGVLPT